MYAIVERDDEIPLGNFIARKATKNESKTLPEEGFNMIKIYDFFLQ